MLFEKLKAFGKQIAEGYQRLEHYFTGGSFAIKFYPFLMHPCVRYSHTAIICLVAIATIFCAIYYLFAEFITILFSEPSLSAYIKHTPLELLLDRNSLIEGKNGQITPLFYAMQVAYLLQSAIFLLFVFFCLRQISSNKFRLLTLLCAVLFSVGVSLIYAAQGGKYTIGGLHNIGFESTFLVGNLTVLLGSLAINRHYLSRLKRGAIFAGLVGTTAIAIPLFIETPYTPMLERLSIYALLCWQIALSFAVLREKS